MFQPDAPGIGGQCGPGLRQVVEAPEVGACLGDAVRGSLTVDADGPLAIEAHELVACSTFHQGAFDRSLANASMVLDTCDALEAALEATWPPARAWTVGPWRIRDGAGGGKRVSAATIRNPDADIAVAIDRLDAAACSVEGVHA